MSNRFVLGLDIGSNSVGSSWIDRKEGAITAGTSVFPAGVDESDDKRGEPKNAKRRMTRRTRITLARRAERKRLLRLRLIEAGLLPRTEAEFKALLERTDPWELRRRGLDQPLAPFEFGRVLLHLAQRRGAAGLKPVEAGDEGDGAEPDAKAKEDGKVKAALDTASKAMLERKARTFGEFIAMVRADRVTAIATPDRRPEGQRKGPREFRTAVRNKAGSYEHCADRLLIRDEFAKLWVAQQRLGGETVRVLTPDLRLALDDESGDTTWRHRGLLFGQRRQSWDLGTLGRCTLHPSERCVPHADMHASRYLVVETVNNLRIVERGKAARPLTVEERQKIKDYLGGPLGVEKVGKRKGQPKRTVSVTDLRTLMGWGRATKTSPFRFNIENDEDRIINTDWFSREVIHGAVTPERWAALPANVRDGLNRALLKCDPDEEADADRLKKGAMSWAGLNEAQADALVVAWSRRPRPDAKRLNLSRRAVRNLLTVMDTPEPRRDARQPEQGRWPTEIEARKALAEDGEFRDETTGEPFDGPTRRRYATGAKGATARDRYYMGKHVLLKGGKPVIGPDGHPLAEPAPAPLIGNPVVRKAIHEVRRHLVEYMTTFGRKPDKVYVELAREAKMGKMDADRLLFRNRLRSRIRNDIVAAFSLHGHTSTQQRAAVDRVVLAVQQGGVCPLCGQPGLTTRAAASGEDCDVAHIIPRASGGHNGLSNIVLAHRKCNRDMGRRTPRQFWSDGAGFEAGLRWVEGIYGEVPRPRFSEVKTATGDALWVCYFTKRDDLSKAERFKMDVKDIQGMTERQEAATKYAARQVMAYIADALYDGKGLPERGTGGEESGRRIFTTDGMWTSRLRREWGLFFDPHDARAKGLGVAEEDERKEKNRGDHRHHAVDAIVTALCTAQVQNAWKKREQDAEAVGVNTADEEAMENYRRAHRLPAPEPFASHDDFREAVRTAVFGNDRAKPICHRPVKRKLIGAFHEETLFGPVLDRAGNLTGNYTAKKSVLALDPNHLRMPLGWDAKEAELHRAQASSGRVGAIKRDLAKMEDPSPAKAGIVRDRALRNRIRHCLVEAGLELGEFDARKNTVKGGFSAGQIKRLIDLQPRLREGLSDGGITPDAFTLQDLKSNEALYDRLRDCIAGCGFDPERFKPEDIVAIVKSGAIRHHSGAPIRTVVLLRTMTDPVVIDRKKPEYATGRLVADSDPASQRAYVGGNNHHIEIRVDAKGRWSGEVVSAFDAAQRKRARLRALRDARIPKPDAFRRLPKAERGKLTPMLRAIEQAHPLVDRRDEAKGGAFVMSLCEGEMLHMKHKETGEVGYFVVAKLDKPRSIVVVPHWDARAATERKDAEGRKVANSKREQFSVTPSDLKVLAPPGEPHARKVRVSPLGVVTKLERD